MNATMRRQIVMAMLAAVGTMSVSLAAAHGPAEGVSQAGGLSAERSLDISQQAIGQKIGDYRFIEAKGATISLAELRGRPLVVSLIYTGCTHICPMITQRLRGAVAEAQRFIGSERFTVITIGFDTRNDTPMRMAAYARAQGVDLPNWRFLSGGEASVAALARDLGFTYTAAAGGFVHAAQTTIVNGEGKVYRQIYGDDFPIQVFMEPLKETVYGTIGTFMSVDSIFDRVRFLCTVYDPNQGRYRISYAIAMSLLTGVISLGVTGIVISRAWLNSRRA
jgi:protein SCO1/2